MNVNTDINKILIVTSEFPPQPGGIGNHAWNVAAQLAKKGFQVQVLTNARSGDGQIESDFDKIQTFKVVRVQRARYSLFTYWNRWKAYHRLLQSANIDVVLASGKFSLWLVGLYKFSKQPKKVGVVHGSEVNLSSLWERILVNKALKKMDTVIAVSNFTKQFIDRLNLPFVKVIPNGFNQKEFGINSNVQREASKRPILITVGALSQRKGQHNVLKALPKLQKKFPEIKYYMVGIPSEKEKLQAMVQQLDIVDLVSFHGALNQKELVYLLGKSDIFVMLSEETKKGEVEGFGIALLEANYLGIPTIGSLNCGIEDAIDNHKSGVLINHHNTQELEDAIQVIMDDYTFYVKNAKEWADQHTWKLVIEKYIEVVIDSRLRSK